MIREMTVIHNALIVNEGEQYTGYVVIEGDIIAATGRGELPECYSDAREVIDASGAMLVPGAIDTHVHFRDGGGGSPKGDIASESRAALAGGVTSYIDMPNTVPPTVSIGAWQKKMEHASRTSVANYAFFIGATNSNLPDLLAADYSRVPGVKLFMGASTGNMLVDSESAILALFRNLRCRISVHAEDNARITYNMADARRRFGDDAPIELHPEIRSREACIDCSSTAVRLAHETGARLHILHISTAEELDLIPDDNRPIEERQLTFETCPHYLTFGGAGDYRRLGARIKCNPSIKEQTDRKALIKAVADGRIDVIATDHAPHLQADKEGGSLRAASGMPGVQFSLPLMMTMADDGIFTPERVVELMSHNPARLYGIERRGFIREGYYADIVLLAPDCHEISDEDVVSRCRWTPYAGCSLSRRVSAVWVNGRRDGSVEAAAELRFNS